MRSGVRGLTLVELMIALALGLLVVGSASAIFISNRQTYRATEGLGRVQENSRMAFELMARDLREAAGNPCGNADRTEPLKLVNLLNGSTTAWWRGWNNGITGYESTTALVAPTNVRVAGTDAVDLMVGDSSSAVTIAAHATATQQFTANTADHGFRASDLAVACDWSQASLFQVSSVAGATIGHQTSGTPGNCTTGLGYANPALACAGGPVRTKQFGPNTTDTNASATLIRMQPVRWYVGTSAGGQSLYRSVVVNEAGTLSVRNQEVAEGVNDMELQYLLEGSTAYVDATVVTPASRWNDVTAVRVTLAIRSADGAGVGGAQLQRGITHTITLRNRME